MSDLSSLALPIALLLLLVLSCVFPLSRRLLFVVYASCLLLYLAYFYF